ncbi:MAG: hypothetical protein IME98_01275 [Proteobacteria bacterium]|nr:hypothetical protein [Pseudomonadota bacterium]
MSRYVSLIKNLRVFWIALLFSVTLIGCTAAYYSGPPRVHFHGPPHLVYIPHTYVYVISDMDEDIYFYGDYWYRYHNNYWFRATFYNGSWMQIILSAVPSRLHPLPGHSYKGYKKAGYRIGHDDLKKNWKHWEDDRRWEKPEKSDKPGKKNKSDKKEKPGKKGKSDKKDKKYKGEGRGHEKHDRGYEGDRRYDDD